MFFIKRKIYRTSEGRFKVARRSLYGNKTWTNTKVAQVLDKEQRKKGSASKRQEGQSGRGRHSGVSLKDETDEMKHVKTWERKPELELCQN